MKVKLPVAKGPEINISDAVLQVVFRETKFMEGDWIDPDTWPVIEMYKYFFPNHDELAGYHERHAWWTERKYDAFQKTMANRRNVIKE